MAFFLYRLSCHWLGLCIISQKYFSPANIFGACEYIKLNQNRNIVLNPRENTLTFEHDSISTNGRPAIFTSTTFSLYIHSLRKERGQTLQSKKDSAYIDRKATTALILHSSMYFRTGREHRKNFNKLFLFINKYENVYFSRCRFQSRLLTMACLPDFWSNIALRCAKISTRPSRTYVRTSPRVFLLLKRFAFGSPSVHERVLTIANWPMLVCLWLICPMAPFVYIAFRWSSVSSCDKLTKNWWAFSCSTCALTQEHNWCVQSSYTDRDTNIQYSNQQSWMQLNSHILFQSLKQEPAEESPE